MNRLVMDFNDLHRPLAKGIMDWVGDHHITLPCLIFHQGHLVPMEILPDPCTVKGNIMSAICPQYHPYLYAEREPRTGEITFPFRKRIGEGKRRQDFDPIYLFVPVFALIQDLNMPVMPFIIDLPIHYTRMKIDERGSSLCAQFADSCG